ncbi:hypothetical protein MRX96_002034 [Rhipicephalus microplus]
MGNGMNKVLPGVYIGNFRDSKDPEQLQANNITHIISIHDTARKLHEDKEYLCIQASDTPGQNLSQFFSPSPMTLFTTLEWKAATSLSIGTLI